MNKFAIAALLGTVSACPFRDWIEHQKENCPPQSEADFPHNRGRSVLKNLYSGYVKGVY
jgi:hypothetical protein